MLKNKFISFLIVSLALTAFLAGYVLVKKGMSPKTDLRTGTILDKFEDGEKAPGDQVLPVEVAKPKLLSERKVSSVVNSTDKNEIIYAEKNTGRIFRLNLENLSEENLRSQSQTDFQSVLWSPNRKEAIELISSSPKIKFRHFGFNENRSTELNNNIHSLAFSPDGNYIGYYYQNEASETDTYTSGRIFISQPNGLYQKKILDTRLKNLELSWPLSDKLALKTELSEVFMLSENGKLTKFLDQKFNLEETWSKNGKKLLFSSSFNPSNSQTWLQVKEVDSKSEWPLSVEGKASKCTWSIDNLNLFCGLSKLPSVDEIYEINTSDGSRKLIAEPEMPVKSLLPTPTEDAIIFINSADEKLYSIKISD